FDQPFEIWPDYGRLNDGCRPEDTYGAVCSLVKEVGAILRGRDPNAFLVGEFCEAYMSQHIDLWMAWYTNIAEAKRAAYALPQTMHSWVVDSDAAQASHAFALGMQLCLCTHGNEATLADEPEFAEHVAALARLRKRCARRTVYSRFNYFRGLDTKGDDTIEAYSFDGPAGPAVIAAAVRGSGRARVSVDRGAFSHPGQTDGGRLCRLDGSEETTMGDAYDFNLKEKEVAVWEL
ncbi:MAG: hypothetical protein JW951_09585, partial [Lentisphaerae bacterium]|nr:hypothetical protein [Lentisphaerota bacterium]